jgi:uncharacterized protein with HEPN domain
MTTSDEVREAYEDSLERLTFNNALVIRNLSELAHEYRHEHARTVVEVIEARIRVVSATLFPGRACC